jgi:hypothetical protein
MCEAPTGQECITGATEHQVWAAMYGAQVTIEDPTPPTLNTPTGPLWGPGETNGYHKGTESITVSAQDIGSGVKNIILAADGQPVAQYETPCNYTYPQPCPTATGNQILTLPTTDLADGTHTLTVTATDATGNQSTIASRQIIVDNNPPPPPTGLTATPTQAGSSTFTVTWTDPSSHVAPITAATYQVCPASGQGACSTEATAPAEGPLTVTVPAPGSWTLLLWLTNAAANSNRMNAARTMLTVPTSLEGSGGSNGASMGNASPGSGSGGSGNVSTPKVTIHVMETLRGRELAVRISCPANGQVRVSFTGRLHDRTVASGTKTITLKHGRLTARFRLGPRTAARATIRVSAQFDHKPTVTSTLRRHT